MHYFFFTLRIFCVVVFFRSSFLLLLFCSYILLWQTPIALNIVKSPASLTHTTTYDICIGIGIVSVDISRKLAIAARFCILPKRHTSSLKVCLLCWCRIGIFFVLPRKIGIKGKRDEWLSRNSNSDSDSDSSKYKNNSISPTPRDMSNVKRTRNQNKIQNTTETNRTEEGKIIKETASKREKDKIK